MSDHSPPSPGAGPDPVPGDRLDSWKEIAAYLKRDVTTVQRWEKREGMPVRRHRHDKVGSVYAFRTDLDTWSRSRAAVSGKGEAGAAAPPRTTWRVWALVGLGAATALAAWQLRDRARAPGNPLEEARFVQLTDFDGVEQAAALSRDGRFAAFLSDRDGRMDVWVTQVGSGEFRNLTRGGVPELVNPSVRTLGFSPDGALVTFWARGFGGGEPPEISIWAAPLFGGPPRRYVDGAAELDWSPDGTRLVYHTPGPGDPMYVREPGAEPRQIFAAPPGLHSHFVLWSPDQAFIYFVQGSLPDRLDVWRIRPSGGAAERLTGHESVVSHPVFLDARTLLYLATEPDGSGPRIYGLDVETRASRRLGFGADAYTSLAASADGRRLVVTKVTPKRTVWRVPLTEIGIDFSAARKLPLTTGNGSSPRFGPDYVLYVSSKGTTDSIWKLQGGSATELWSAPDARVVGPPAIRRDGRRIAFTARQGERTRLLVMNDDGSDARVVSSALEPQGAPAWAPGGDVITVASLVEGAPRLFNVSPDGRPPVRLVSRHSIDPVWSPADDMVVFSGADIGTTFPVTAARTDGSEQALPGLLLTRGARHIAFLPQGRSLLVLRGEIRHKDLWRIDLDSGAEHRVSEFAPDFDVRDFDVSPDGREILLEQVQEHSDVLLIEPGEHRVQTDPGSR